MLAALFELVGVGSIMPFVATAAQPASVERVPALALVYHGLGFSSARTFLVFWGVLVLAALGVVNLLTATIIWLGCRFGNQLQLELSSRLYHGYLVKAYEWHLSRHSAALFESLTRARLLAELVFRPLVTLLARGLSALVLVLTLVWLDPFVTVLTALVLGMAFSGIYLESRRRLRQVSEAESAAGFRLATSVADSFGALKQIQMSGCESFFVDSYRQQIESMGKFMMRRTWISEVPRLALHSLTNMAILLLVVYLEATLGQPEMLIPMVSVYALAGYRIIPGLQLCLSCMLAVESSGPVLEALFLDLQETPEGPPRSVPRPLPVERAIALRAVSYSYPQGERPVVSGCTLEIAVGSKVGLVGASGLGKTTLVNLLAGLLRPQEGWLEADGQVLEGENLRRWRCNIGYVPQDVFLMDDSIAANIALGTPGGHIDGARLRLAARQAALEETIDSLPRGFDTLVGEKGIRLSGGQRQRIGLARALYHQPRFLLLDEATSALDSGTEAGLLKTLQGLSGSITMVLVAHRLTTVCDCDRIFVIGEGGVVAQGTYAELLRDSPEFQAIAPEAVA